MSDQSDRCIECEVLHHGRVDAQGRCWMHTRQRLSWYVHGRRVQETARRARRRAGGAVALVLALTLGCGGADFSVHAEAEAGFEVSIEIGAEVSAEIGEEASLVDTGLDTGRPDAGPELGPDTSPPTDTAPPPDTGPPPSVWSAEFTGGSAPGAQCSSWNAWRAALSPSRVYTKITLTGTFDPAGVTCTGPNANVLCQALRTGTDTGVTCLGTGWGTQSCGAVGEVALRAKGSMCTCSGYSVRPCGGFVDFGGVNSSCPPPSQTMTVVCE